MVDHIKNGKFNIFVLWEVLLFEFIKVFVVFVTEFRAQQQSWQGKGVSVNPSLSPLNYVYYNSDYFPGGC